MEPLAAVMHALEQGTPYLFIDDLSIYRNPVAAQEAGFGESPDENANGASSGENDAAPDQNGASADEPGAHPVPAPAMPAASSGRTVAAPLEVQFTLSGYVRSARPPAPTASAGAQP